MGINHQIFIAVPGGRGRQGQGGQGLIAADKTSAEVIFSAEFGHDSGVGRVRKRIGEGAGCEDLGFRTALLRLWSVQIHRGGIRRWKGGRRPAGHHMRPLMGRRPLQDRV